MRLRNFASLLRWLGPWTPDTRVPPGIARETWTIREGELRGHRAYLAGLPRTGATTHLDAYVYRPASPVAIYLVSPGLHFAGPDDPRLDRFCRVLAASGFLVVAPFLPAFTELRVESSSVDDLETVLLATRARFPEYGRVALFSISFGSLPALEVAARRPDDVDGVVTFGGYAEFESVVRFCVDGVMHGDDGPVSIPFDPLNMPALFINVMRFLGLEEPRALEQAFNVMCYRTWGRMELKAEGRLVPFYEALVADVPEAHRTIFRLGTLGGEDARAVVEEGLFRGREELAYLSPRAAITRIACPVVICHGRDDDVIPWGEAVKLHRALAPRVPTRLHLTGLFSHTGQGAARPADALREVQTMLAMAHAIANGGRLRHVVR